MKMIMGYGDNHNLLSNKRVLLKCDNSNENYNDNHIH